MLSVSGLMILFRRKNEDKGGCAYGQLIVRISRRDADDPRGIAGIVEIVEQEETKAFCRHRGTPAYSFRFLENLHALMSGIRGKNELREDMGADKTTNSGRDMTAAKRTIADTFRQLGLVDETYTGEVTVGFTSGGVMFIRKSETLK